MTPELNVYTNFLDKDIAVVYINRENKANSYNQEMLNQLLNELQKLNSNKDIRSIIVTGVGDKNFCAGADLEEMKSKRAEDGIYLLSREVFNQLNKSPKFTIAAINGKAFGGGFELALSCDLRVSKVNSSFCFPESTFDLLPSAGGIKRLPSFVSRGLAFEMIFFNKLLTAEEAFNAGLVSYSGDNYWEKTLEYCHKVRNTSSLTLSLAKISLNHSYSNLETDYEALIQGILYERKYFSK